MTVFISRLTELQLFIFTFAFLCSKNFYNNFYHFNNKVQNNTEIFMVDFDIPEWQPFLSHHARFDTSGRYWYLLSLCPTLGFWPVCVSCFDPCLQMLPGALPFCCWATPATIISYLSFKNCHTCFDFFFHGLNILTVISKINLNTTGTNTLTFCFTGTAAIRRIYWFVFYLS